jgi:hypothetical protein
MRAIYVDECRYGECPYYERKVDVGHGGECWDRCAKYKKEIPAARGFPAFCNLKFVNKCAGDE